jgi:hypothetical protein
MGFAAHNPSYTAAAYSTSSTSAGPVPKAR